MLILQIEYTSDVAWHVAAVIQTLGCTRVHAEAQQQCMAVFDWIAGPSAKLTILPGGGVSVVASVPDQQAGALHAAS